MTGVKRSQKRLLITQAASLSWTYDESSTSFIHRSLSQYGSEYV